MMNAASTSGVVALLVAQVAAFLALLLVASGLHKLIRSDRSRSVAREFGGVPRVLAPFAVVVVALAEMLAGAALLTAGYRALGGLVAASIWAAYLGLILRAIAQGRRDVDCGCTLGSAHRPLGAFQVTRNAVLVAMGVVVGLGAWSGSGAWWGAGVPMNVEFTVGASGIASQIVAVVALAALYGALEQVMALKPPRGGVLL
jgi:hypothetical protein